MPAYRPAPERFWEKVDVRGPDECWEWQACRQKPGYGRFSPRSRVVTTAHRYAYELAYGPVGPGMVVRHHCDNPPCVNPRHLAIGTDRDNHLDARGRGRWVPPPHSRGEGMPSAVLTDEAVRQIRARYVPRKVSQYQLAAEFGVSKTTIGAVLSGKTWRHVS